MKFIQIINSQYDNKMKQVEVNRDVLLHLKKSIEHPLLVEDKNYIPQWKFCSVIGDKRCNENMDKTDILMLDYDDSNMTIEEFKNRFREYKFILHTSYSYDGIKQKFRVLLFLDKEYVIDRMFYKCSERVYSPYHYLMNRFDYVDPASFVKSQFFKVPAVKTKDSPYYCYFNMGKCFNLFDIEGYKIAYDECYIKQEEYLRKLEKEYERFRKKNQGDLSKAKEYVEKKIDSTPEGQRHNCIFGLAAWFSRIGGSYEEFSRILPSWADKQYKKQVKRLASEWTKIGMYYNRGI